MDTEHENLQRLFGAAVDDAGLDGDVVPGVLAGYDRRVRARRFQAAGGTLAVLAVAAGAVALTPHGRGHTTSVASPASSSPAPDFQNAGCHQHWNAVVWEAAGGRPPATLNEDGRAACQALMDSLQGVAPGAQLVPQIFPDLKRDQRIDQQQLKLYGAAAKPGDPTGGAKASPDFAKKVQAEIEYLKAHPEDPANVANGGFFLVSPTGRQDLEVHRWPNKPPADQVPTECANEPSDYKKDASCIPIGIAGGWHGTITRYPQPQQMFFLGAMLTDGRGDYIELDSYGEDPTRHLSAPVTNATAMPVLTTEQFTQWFSSPGFQTFLDDYLKYAQELPPVGPHGAPLTPTTPPTQSH